MVKKPIRRFDPGLAFLLACLSFAALRSQNSHAATWYVNAASEGGNGSSDQPYSTIQAGVDVAQPGDTVLVAGGTYYETVKTQTSGVDSSNGITYYIYVIAAGDGPAVVKAQENFGFVIHTDHNYIWIEGFHITCGYGTSTAHGSGIRTFGSYGVFIHNYIYDNDVGVFCEGDGGSDESLNNRGNVIAYNVISDAGEAAVRMKRSSENEVMFNLMYHNGYRIAPDATVTYYGAKGNHIINNTIWDSKGAALQVYNGTNPDSNVACTECIIQDNIMARPAPGVLLTVDSKSAAESSNVYSHNVYWTPVPDEEVIWWGPEFSEGGVHLTVHKFAVFADSINAAIGEGSQFADPLFQAPFESKFDLLPGSPAIDAGSRLASEAVIPGPAGMPGASALTARMDQMLDGGVVDVGYHHEPYNYGTNPELDADFKLTLRPNPYSGYGAIIFTLPNVPSPRRINAKIYNVLGRLVDQIEVPDDAFNEFALHWNASNVANGVYYIVLNVNGKRIRDRIVLIK